MKAPGDAIKWMYNTLPKTTFILKKLIGLQDTQYGAVPIYQDHTVSGILVPVSGIYTYEAGGIIYDYDIRLFVPATFPNTTITPSLGDKIVLGNREADIVRIIDYDFAGYGIVLKEIQAR